MKGTDLFDVIVIGTGAGGGPAINHLVAAGFNVAAVERGDWISTEVKHGDELQYLFNRNYIPRPGTFPIELLHNNGGAELQERDWMCHAVGGATMIWYGHLLRLKEEDFLMKHLFGNHPVVKETTIADWPVTLAEMAPWYQQVEEEMMLYGIDGCQPPLPDYQLDGFVAKKLSANGYNLYKTPSCLGGQAFDVSPFDPQSGKPVNTHFSAYRRNSANVYVAPNLGKPNFKLFTRSVAEKINFSNGEATGVQILSVDNKSRHSLRAPLVIVSCSAIESALLFMRSGVPDPFDLVGRNLTYLTDCTAECMLPQKRIIPQGEPHHAIGTYSMDDYYLINDKNEPGLFKGGKVSFSDRWVEKGPIAFGLSRSGWGSSWKQAFTQAKENLILHLSFKGEALPLYSNRVQPGKSKDAWGLDVAAVSYTLPEHDLLLAGYMGEQLKKICLQLGAAESSVKISPRTYATAGHGHQHGTLRFGESAGTSVLDPWCQSHHIKGLYALDGSFMPTSGGTNSSLTYMANSLRVANHISKTHI
jgi:choline dehydrogenase-like flavoprotein